MIPVARMPAPQGFDEHVRARGLAWIEQQRRPITRFPDYWRWCEPNLHDAFHGRCGWAAVAITSGQVEHFVSQATCVARGHPQLAYDWDNFRYIMPELNSKKHNHPAILDPFDVQSDWFEIELPSLHLKVTAYVPDSHRELARSTCGALGLERGFKLMRQRRAYLRQYRAGKVQIEFFDDVFPLLAKALRKLFDASNDQLSEEQRNWRTELADARRQVGASVP